MDVLVCGGAGYVGSFLSKRLVEQGHRVIVIDNLSVGRREYIDHPQIKLVEANLLNEKNLYLLFHRHNIEAVFHLALLSPHSIECTSASRSYRNNVVGTMNLLSRMRAAKVNNLIFASSGHIYGDRHGEALDEKTPTAPESAFATTTTTIERMLVDFCDDYQLNSVSLRFHNAAGLAEQYHDYQWHDENPPELVKLLQAFQTGNQSEFAANGNNQSTTDGSIVREYLHVIDVCEAHIKAMEYLVPGNPGAHQFNLGSEQNVSQQQLIELARKVTGSEGSFETEHQAEDPVVQTLSGKMAKKLLGWEAQYNIEDIMQSIWQVIIKPEVAPLKVASVTQLNTQEKQSIPLVSEQTLADKLKFWHRVEVSAKIAR